MEKAKEPLMSQTMVEILLGFICLIGLYFWKYDSISVGWRFIGMVIISLVVGVITQLFLMMISSRWDIIRNEHKSNQMCRNLGIPTDSTNPEDISKCWDYMVARYSDDLFSNRASNFIGIITSCLSVVISVGITLLYFAQIAYFVWQDNYYSPLMLWIPLVLHLSLYLFLALVNAFSLLFFNRTPGEARAFNKSFDKMKQFS